MSSELSQHIRSLILAWGAVISDWLACSRVESSPNQTTQTTLSVAQAVAGQVHKKAGYPVPPFRQFLQLKSTKLRLANAALTSRDSLGQVALWAGKWARGLLELLAKDCFFYTLETGLRERKFIHVTHYVSRRDRPLILQHGEN